MPEAREILRKRFISRVILVAILAAALLFRLWGMGFGLPQKVHPDEPLLIDRAIEAGAKGDFNPGFFYWPNFLIYFLYLEYAAIYYIGYLFGFYHNLKEFFISYYIDPTFFMWAGRVTTTLFCIMGMSFLYLIGKKIAGTAAGLAAAVLMGFNVTFIMHSRFATPDIPAASLMICVWFCLLRYIDSGRTRMLYFAAFVGGVAVSTKYNAGLMLIPILIAAASNVQRQPEGGAPKSSRRIGTRILLCLVLVGLGFFLFTPYSLLDIKEFWRQVHTQAAHQWIGHIGMEAKGSSLVAVAAYFYTPYGIALLVLSLFGLPGLARPVQRGLILLSFPLLYLFSIAGWIVWNERYLIYLLPIIFLAAGVSLGRIAGFLLPRWKELAAVLFALILTSPSIAQAVRSSIIMSRPHTTVVAEKWIERNIPHGSILFIEMGGPEPYSITTVKEFNLDVYPVYAFEKPELWWNVKGNVMTPLEKLSIIQPIPGYIISTGYTHDRYFDPETQRKYPELVKPWVEYYDFIEKHCELLAEFQSDDEYFGPWIRIWRLPPGALG